MKLTEVIAIWDILHEKDTGELGYCDLENAICSTVGVENDILPCQPQQIRRRNTSNEDGNAIR